MKKIDKNLLQTIALFKNNKKIDCLVYYNNYDKTRNYLDNSGIKIVKHFSLINALAIEIECEKINDIAVSPFVTYVSSNAKVSALVNVSRKILNAVDIENKDNISVAVVDTGTMPHLDLVLGKNRIIKFVDLVNGVNHPYDDNGHGTFVTGVMAGNGLLSNGKYKGFATNCNIVSIKALDNKGESSAVRILEAMEWIGDNYKNYNIKVVCMSFGSEPLGFLDPIMKGAEALWQKGIVVVSAGGNSGPKFETIKSPGISNKIITVGGFNDNRLDETYNQNFFEIADFSSRGPALGKIKPDVVAPAVDITSISNKGGYTSYSGTSVATPMIAGLSATLIKIKPDLSPNQVKRYLMASATPITYNKYQEGSGYPDLSKIIR